MKGSSRATNTANSAMMPTSEIARNIRNPIEMDANPIGVPGAKTVGNRVASAFHHSCQGAQHCAGECTKVSISIFQGRGPTPQRAAKENRFANLRLRLIGGTSRLSFTVMTTVGATWNVLSMVEQNENPIGATAAASHSQRM